MMKSTLLDQAAKLLKDHSKRSRWMSVVLCLALAVTAGTFYTLMRQGQAMVRTEKVLQCPYTPHVHTVNCDGGRSCGVAEYAFHTHGDYCFDAEGGLACTLPEIPAHEHGEDCWRTESVLVCALPESLGHRHTEDCYPGEEAVTPPEGGPEDAVEEGPELLCLLEEHVHDESCYMEGIDRVLVCGSAKGEGAHQHGPDCYTAELTCDLEKGSGHEHSRQAGCYRKEPVCGLMEDGEHVHGDECFRICHMTEEDGHVHTDDCNNYVLNCDQSTEGHVHSAGCYRETLACDQEESLGHTHTDECYSRGDVITRNLVCLLEEHVHSEDCYAAGETEDPADPMDPMNPMDPMVPVSPMDPVDPEEPAVREPACGLEESEAGHVHGNGCYEERTILVCTASGVHTHTPDCRDEEGRLICGQLQIDEHIHGPACLIDVEPDGDTVGTYICGLEEHIHGPLCLVSCDKEEHRHSSECLSGGAENPEDPEDPEAPGGAEDLWKCGRLEHLHGEACCNKAGEPVCGLEEHVHSNDCLAEPEPEPDWKCGKQEHVHSGDCCDELGEFVCGLEEHAHTEACLTEPEPDWKCGKQEHVHQGPCYLTESGELVCEREEHVHSEACLTPGEVPFTFSETDPEDVDGVRVIVSGAASALPCPPESVTLTVKRLHEEDPVAEKARSLVTAVVEAGEGPAPAAGEETKTAREITKTIAFEISLRDSEGREIEPTGSLRLAFANLPGATEQGEKLEIYHVDTETEQARDMGAAEDENGNLAMETDHFSPYIAIYSVETRDAGAVVSVDNAADLKKYLQEGDRTIRLANDIEIGDLEPITVGQGKTTVLDLNGHTLTLSHVDPGRNFDIIVDGANTSFTVTDKSGVVYGEEIVEQLGEVTYNDAGLCAEYKEEGDKATLVYYVTKSVPDPSKGVGYTKETREKHKVEFTKPTGKIICGQNHYTSFVVRKGASMTVEGGLFTSGSTPVGRLFDVHENGKLNLEGGWITGVNCTYGDGAAVLAREGGVVNLSGTVLSNNKKWGIYLGNTAETDRATLNITGGYICGNTADGYQEGAAVFGKGPVEVNMSGGVIAANRANQAPGIKLNSGANLTVSGGVVSGNYATDLGGGIQTWGNVSVAISGGYITNNRSDGPGGGLNMGNGGTLTVTGGQITGNRGQRGGGIITTAQFTLTGGFISGNVALDAAGTGGGEGGGINLSSGGTCVASGGYVTNNATPQTGDWGGGGIFCSDNNCKLMVEYAIITGNTADGFGGGVAGCSTGRLTFAAANGAAIYSNTAKGETMAGSLSSKHKDQEAKNDTVFMDNGYQDYFCALASVVQGGMLGSGSSEWKGSADGRPVGPVSKGMTLDAADLMGLTAHPSQTDITNAEMAARLFITGNHSNTHGGGILSNGHLMIGEPGVFEIPKGLSFQWRKNYMSDGMSLPVTKDQFQFELTDGNGKVIREVGNDAEGLVQFFLAFSAPGTYTYSFREVKGTDASITYDTSVYQIKVEVQERTETWDLVGRTVTQKTYVPKKVWVTKGTEEVYKNEDIYYDTHHNQTVNLTNDAPFINYKFEEGTTSFTVYKKWAEGSNETAMAQGAKMRLTQNGKPYGDQVTLTAETGWTHTWSNLPLKSEAGEPYTYDVEEIEIPAGFVAVREDPEKTIAGKYFVPVSADEALSLDGLYMIVSKDGYALTANAGSPDAELTNSKTPIGNPVTITVNGKEVQAYDRDDINEANIFVAQRYDGKTALKSASANSWLLAQASGENWDSNWRLKGTSGIIYTEDFVLKDGVLVSTTRNDDRKKEAKLDSNGNVEVDSSGNTVYKTLDNSVHYSAISYREGQFVLEQVGSVTEPGNAGLDKIELDKMAAKGSVTIYRLAGQQGSTSVTITNTPEDQIQPVYTLELFKTDEAGHTLRGAKFQLCRTDENGELIPLRFAANGGAAGSYRYYAEGDVVVEGMTLVDTIVTDQQGNIHAAGIPAGTYILRETEPPLGYNRVPDQELVFGEENPKITDQVLELELVDPEVRLPQTAGPGTTAYTLAGGLLALCAGGLLLGRKRRGRAD